MVTTVLRTGLNPMPRWQLGLPCVCLRAHQTHSWSGYVGNERIPARATDSTGGGHWPQFDSQHPIGSSPAQPGVTPEC